ncbi:hypothetical protein HYQ46_005531 [Verticillium longisporum]|nr:hypothetical protein HYQ46_005531 [Verticillium longisporum]
MPSAAPSQNQKHSNRVLRLKNSTRRASAGGISSGPTPSTSTAATSWSAAPVSRAPPSSNAFPSLAAAAATPSSSTSSASASRPSWIGPNNHAQGNTKARARVGNTPDNFPALPAAAKPQTTTFGYGTGRGVRRDFGVTRDTGFSWGSGAEGSADASANPSEREDEGGESAGGKKKKGNKGKKVLVQWARQKQPRKPDGPERQVPLGQRTDSTFESVGHVFVMVSLVSKCPEEVQKP